MGSVGWLRSAAPGSAPPPINKLGLCSESACQASGQPGGHHGPAGLGSGAGRGLGPGVGRCSAGLEPPRRQGAPARLGPGLVLPAHLQLLTGKCALRWLVPCAALPRLEWPGTSQRLRRPGIPEHSDLFGSLLFPTGVPKQGQRRSQEHRKLSWGPFCFCSWRSPRLAKGPREVSPAGFLVSVAG